MPGKNLAIILQERGKLSAAEVWYVLESLMPIVELIHSHQVIHRDIKPENILYSEIHDSEPQPFKVNSNQSLKNGSIVLVDWSPSQRISTQFSTLQFGTIGSPEYSAPEQLTGNAVFASDLYSLGVTCIHLLTGLAPFDLIDSASNRWVWRTYWEYETGDSTQADQCPQLADVLDRLIEPALHQRFASASAAIAQIQALRRKTIFTPKPVQTWRSYATLMGHQGLFAGVNAVAIDPSSNRVASASDDTTIRLWDLSTGAAQFTLKGHAHWVQCLAFCPSDATLMVSGSRDRTLKLWNLQQRPALHTLIGHQSAVNTVAFSPDGRILASGSGDKTVKLWNPQTGQLTTTLTGARLAITAIAFSPVTPILVGASADSIIRVWDLTTLKQIQTLTDHRSAVRAIAFSPDGALLATGGEDRTIRLWETTCWQCIRVFPGHSWSISALTFMPNGEALISGSWDKTMKVWQVRTGIEREVLTGHLDTVSCVAIAEQRSATLIASSSLDKTIRLWKR